MQKTVPTPNHHNTNEQPSASSTNHSEVSTNTDYSERNVNGKKVNIEKPSTKTKTKKRKTEFSLSTSSNYSTVAPVSSCSQATSQSTSALEQGMAVKENLTAHSASGEIKACDYTITMASNTVSAYATFAYYAVELNDLSNARKWIQIMISKGGNIDQITRSGKTLLMKAACCNAIEISKFLIGHPYQADVNVRDKNGNTALLFASDQNILELLIKNGAKLTDTNKKGETILLRAAQSILVKLATIQYLITNGADVNRTSNESETPLILILRNILNSRSVPLQSAYCKEQAEKILDNVRTDIARLLLESGAKNSINTQNKKEMKETALIYSARTGKKDIVDLLLSYGAATNMKSSDGKAALQLAAQGGHYEICKLLLENDADINASDYSGTTALHESAYRGDLKLLTLFKEAGANTEMMSHRIIFPFCVQHRFSTPLVIAIQQMSILKGVENQNYARIIHYLLNNGANVNTGYCYTKTTPLMLAHHFNLKDIVRLLIDRGAKIDSQNFEGKTILMFGSIFPDSKGIETLRFLLKNGGKAIVNRPDNNGDTPLFYTIRSNNVKKSTLLIKYGAEVRHKNKNGLTPFLSIVNSSSGLIYTKKRLQFLQLLLENGAHIDEQNPADGRTVAHTAIENLYPGYVLTLLIKYKANLDAQDLDGNTPLHIAAFHTLDDRYRILLNAGANPELKNKKGVTPTEILRGGACSMKLN